MRGIDEGITDATPEGITEEIQDGILEEIPEGGSGDLPGGVLYPRLGDVAGKSESLRSFPAISCSWKASHSHDLVVQQAYLSLHDKY